MTKTTRWALPLAYAYIALPFAIFVLGWMRWYYSLPLLAGLGYAFYLLCRKAPAVWRPEWSGKKDLARIAVIAAVILAWVWLSGIGRYAFQNSDHYVRNTMFDMLVNYKWPLVDPGYVSPTGEAAPRAMIYYIGFWLPAAAVAKVFHSLSLGYFVQFVWAALGIFLVYYFICVRARKLAVWPILVLIFFSGLDIFEQLFLGNGAWLTDWTYHLETMFEGWNNATGTFEVQYQYSAPTTQLFWVFNQCIPAWLCTLLIFNAEDNRAIVFVLACSMLTSTMPFLGLLMLVVYLVFARKWKDTFTFPNVLGGGIVGIVSFLYFLGNDSGSVSDIFPWQKYWGTLLFFLACEVFVYALLIWKYHIKNGIFYYILVCLCVIPIFRIGTSRDFCMRVSIPLLFILMLLVIDALRLAWQRKDKLIFAGLVVVLLLGSITPIHEIWRTVSSTYTAVQEGTPLYPPSATEYEVLSWPNFSGSAEDSFFFRYLAQK